MKPATTILLAGKPASVNGTQSNTVGEPKTERFDLPMMARLML